MQHQVWRLCLIVLAGLTFLSCASTGERPSLRSERSRAESAQELLRYDWKYELRPGILPALGAHSIENGHLAVRAGYVIAGSTDGQLVILKENSGEKVWQQKFDVGISAGPVISGKSVYWCGTDGSVHRMNAKQTDDGTVQLNMVWTVDTGAPIEGSLTVEGDSVYVVNANNRVFALNAKDGSIRWKHERPRSSEFTMYGQAKPHVAGDRVYVGYSDGTFSSYAISNGTVIWTKNLSAEIRFKDIDAEAAVAGGKVYVANSSWGVYCLDVDDGRILWKQPLDGVRSFFVDNDTLYLSSNSGIVRMDAETGMVIWRNILRENALFSPLAVGDHNLYVSIQRFGLAVLDRESGETRHIIDVGSDFTSEPVLTDGALYALSNRGTVYRYLIRDLPLK